NIVLYLANDSLVVERENLLSVLNQRPVGAIISHLGGGNEDILNQLAEQIPVVLIDRYPQEWPGSFVVTDNYKGAHQLTEALLEHGFSRIHHIVSHEYVSSTRDRLAGYLSVMRSHGLTTEKLVHQITADPIGDVTVADATYQITRQIIAEESYPYALFGTNTEVMASIWQAVQDANVDLSQVGLACFDAPAFFIPPEAFFVQAEQPLAKIGHQSVHVVMDQVHGIHDPRRIMLDPIVKYPTVEIQTI
ncbi:MAG TPA: substrate-binding domain-containing protein, partial [Armatimonadota bacterium]|nr:substrate-binding domain-containing protein [Armatimonadota bacterium]